MVAFQQPHECPPSGQLANRLDHMIQVTPPASFGCQQDHTIFRFCLLSLTMFRLVMKGRNSTQNATIPRSLPCTFFSLVQTCSFVGVAVINQAEWESTFLLRSCARSLAT